MEGGNLGVGEQERRAARAAVGFIMSEHTQQLYLPSHLSERRGEEGAFFAVFAQLKANARAPSGTLIPYKEGRNWGNKGEGRAEGGRDVAWERWEPLLPSCGVSIP